MKEICCYKGKLVEVNKYYLIFIRKHHNKLLMKSNYTFDKKAFIIA